MIQAHALLGHSLPVIGAALSVAACSGGNPESESLYGDWICTDTFEQSAETVRLSLSYPADGSIHRTAEQTIDGERAQIAYHNAFDFRLIDGTLQDSNFLTIIDRAAINGRPVDDDTRRALEEDFHAVTLKRSDTFQIAFQNANEVTLKSADQHLECKR